MDLAAIAVPDAGSQTSKEKGAAVGEKRGREAPAEHSQGNRHVDDMRRLLEPPEPRSGGVDVGRGRRSSSGSVISKRKLILKLRSYATAFPDICKDMVKNDVIESLEEGELSDLMDEVKFAVGAKTSGIVTGQVTAGLVHITKDILKEHTSLQVDGPACSLDQIIGAKDFKDLSTEVTLEYADWVYSKPENRLMAYLAQAVYTIHKVNQAEMAKTGTAEPAAKRARVEPEVVAAAEVQEAAQPLPGMNPNVRRDKDGFELPVEEDEEDVGPGIVAGTLKPVQQHAAAPMQPARGTQLANRGRGGRGRGRS